MEGLMPRALRLVDGGWCIIQNEESGRGEIQALTE